VVFSSVRLNKKKRISEKRTEIFLEFLVFLEESKLKRKTKTRKTIYTGELPTSKRRTRKSFWVFFLLLQLAQLERKTKKKREIYFLGFLKVFQTHKKKARK
jgi:hypothetical protein